MTSIKVRELLAVGAVAMVATYLVVRSFYGSFPPIPALAGSSLLVLAVIMAVLGFVVRERVRTRRVGDGPGLLHPLMVARFWALARASATVGAAVTGVWAGYLLYVLPARSTLRAAADDTTGVVVGLVSSVALVAAALWLEYCCRTPDDDTEPDADPAH